MSAHRLAALDMDRRLSARALRHVLPELRERAYELSKRAHQRELPVIVVFEGWDGAGKNQNIRELSRRLDPRGFKVLETHPPRRHELQKPWLWRFWMQIPRRGQIAIFDRSWYGRVLVERVDGITPIPDWIRAYEEINAFERTLADDGTVMIKLWLHIDREEQLRRFIRWTRDPQLAWQVAAEDWDHHRQYETYLAALHDVLSNCDQPHAPWVVVPANDERYATYCVFRTLIDRLETSLDLAPTDWPSLDELEAQARAAEQQAAAKRKARKKKRQKVRRAAARAAQETAAELLGERAADSVVPSGPSANDGRQEAEAEEG